MPEGIASSAATLPNSPCSPCDRRTAAQRRTFMQQTRPNEPSQYWMIASIPPGTEGIVPLFSMVPAYFGPLDAVPELWINKRAKLAHRLHNLHAQFGAKR